MFGHFERKNARKKGGKSIKKKKRRTLNKKLETLGSSGCMRMAARLMKAAVQAGAVLAILTPQFQIPGVCA